MWKLSEILVFYTVQVLVKQISHSATQLSNQHFFHFFPNVPFLPPGNIRKPCGFQGVEKGWIGNKWINLTNKIKVFAID